MLLFSSIFSKKEQTIVVVCGEKNVSQKRKLTSMYGSYVRMMMTIMMIIMATTTTITTTTTTTTAI